MNTEYFVHRTAQLALSDEIHEDRYTYQCITKDMVKDIPGIAQYFDGAEDDDHKQCKEFNTMSSVLYHRFVDHGKHPMVFLRTKHQQHLCVKEIVRCTLKCDLCATNMDTRRDISYHFRYVHPLSWPAFTVISKSKMIEPNDLEQPFQLCHGFLAYNFSILKCSQPDCGSIVQTRTKAIDHYNECHNDIGSKIHGFQVKYDFDNIGRELFLKDSQETFHMYLFECQHCQKLFNSWMSIERHFTAIRSINPDVELHFAVERLYCCLYDGLIRTYTGMQQLYKNQHGDVNKKLFLPVDMLSPEKMCGICDYNYHKNDDLVQHYTNMHSTINAYTNEFLMSLGLTEIKEHLCEFKTSCCENNKRYSLQQIVDHVLNCNHRFVCVQCRGQFTNAKIFIIHHMQDHSLKLFSEFSRFENCFDQVVLLMLYIQIILPNGFVTVLRELEETKYAEKVLGEMMAFVKNMWESQRKI